MAVGPVGLEGLGGLAGLEGLAGREENNTSLGLWHELCVVSQLFIVFM